AAQTPAPKPAQTAPAPAATASGSGEANPVVLSNQMMITFMERFKSGNFAEARKIVDDMLWGVDKVQDTPTKVYRAFSNLMGKHLFEHQLRTEGTKAEVEWLQQPYADGYYFQALLAFHEKKVPEALEALQKAISWDPVRAAFHIERGFMMMHLETPPELAMVMATYLKALELADNRQDFAAAMRGIGFVFVEKMDLTAGLAAYMVAQKFDPEDKTAPREIDYIRAQAPGLTRLLDDGKAISLLSERRIPVTIDPIHVKVLTEIATDLEQKQNTRELKAILRRILDIDPANANAKKKLTALP
ncbi:MAG TPA: tetratricopeptide repeat protein, partial [Candidatus Ozemobacteraceae bacterium]|nr:tetratricopeptide repeat protein [Candidatus Ozemobacteraceae bacterium]